MPWMEAVGSPSLIGRMLDITLAFSVRLLGAASLKRGAPVDIEHNAHDAKG